LVRRAFLVVALMMGMGRPGRAQVLTDRADLAGLRGRLAERMARAPARAVGLY